MTIRLSIVAHFVRDLRGWSLTSWPPDGVLQVEACTPNVISFDPTILRFKNTQREMLTLLAWLLTLFPVKGSHMR